jgi:AP-3 complex subunit mu
VRDNFSLILQLLDEIIDGGFPFTTEPNQLKEMIVPPSLANKVIGALSSNQSAVRDEVATAALSKIPWRRHDVRYVSNEIFFDIIEALDVTLAADQSVVSAQAYGEVRSRCHLSHMPDVSIAFQQSHLLEDCTLHRCVRIARFAQDRVVSFVPPDGDFTLMTYRVNGVQRIPISVRPEFVWSKESCKFSVAVAPQPGAGPQEHLTDVVITLPLPTGTQNSQIAANVGTVRVDQVSKTCRWELPTFPKDALPVLEGTFYFATNTPSEDRPTIRVQFEMPKQSATGIKIESMNVKNVKYTPQRGVRNVTRAGRFQVRTA